MKIYALVLIASLFFVYAGWQIFVRTLPPIKVEIVGGCK